MRRAPHTSQRQGWGPLVVDVQTHEQVADNGLLAFEAILRLVNAMVAGKLPHLNTFLDSNLIAVGKASGQGVQPIAVGEVWVRIAALCAMAASPGARASLPLLQLGVGVCGGINAAGNALRVALALHSRLQVARINYQNAFDTVSCRAVLQAVAAPAPELLPLSSGSQLCMQTLARLRSLAYRVASAWLEAVPTTCTLRLSYGDFQAALCRRLSKSNLPEGAPAASCRALLLRSPRQLYGYQASLTCLAPHALRVLRHDENHGCCAPCVAQGGSALHQEAWARCAPTTCDRAPATCRRM
jgi:hypothetical protein